MKNCNELRNELSEVFKELRAGSITVDQAAELANVAGKIVSSAKVQIAYYELLKSQPHIEFLDDDSAG
jgi:hypothetical protein